MASHSFPLKLSGPSDHLIACGWRILIGRGKPQRHGVDQQVYRIGEGQRRLSRVTLVAEFDANGCRHQPGVPVAAFGMKRRLTSEVGGSLQAVRGAFRDVAQLPAPERFTDGMRQPFGFSGAPGDLSQIPQHVGDAAYEVSHLVDGGRGDVQIAHTLGVAWVAHRSVSGSFACCGNYVPGCAQ